MMLLPAALMLTNRLSDAQTVAPGIIVTGKAWTDGPWSLSGSMKATLPIGASGWYWEVAAQSPAGPAVPEEDLHDLPASDEPLTDPSSVTFFMDTVKDAGLLSQAKLTGALVHYQCFQETAECQIKIGRDPVTKQLRMDGDVTVATKSGFRIRLFQAYLLLSDLGLRAGMDPHDRAEFGIELDPKTVGSGLPNKPERLDIWISPPDTFIPPDVFAGLTSGLSLQALQDHKLSASWSLWKSQVEPVMNLKLRINRRVADRKLPFSLIVPLQRRDGQSVAPPAP